VWAIVPARLDARRVERKPLRLIEGRPLLLHVLERAGAASCVGRVVCATDSDEIAEVVGDAGHEVVRTGAAANGTERVAQAVRALGGAPRVVVNVQGDQPWLEPSHVDAAVQRVREGFDVGTVRAPLVGPPERVSRVKVVVDRQGRALYFSRSPIPHGGPFWLHVGIYAFDAAALPRCAAAATDPATRGEGLEQLAWMAEGIAIGVATVDRAEAAVDEEADLVRAQRSSHR
jgi:3-deoxy-manno-octulosonate cytidylyltransferase (CMP-KDO synthetase)